MHLGNPKAVLVWLAVMTLGVGSHASAKRVAAAYFGCILLGGIIFFGYALLFSTAPVARAYVRARRWIEGALAVTLTGAGVRLLTSR